MPKGYYTCIYLTYKRMHSTVVKENEMRWTERTYTTTETMCVRRNYMTHKSIKA